LSREKNRLPNKFDYRETLLNVKKMTRKRILKFALTCMSSFQEDARSENLSFEIFQP
jgi:hypothetical protein